MRRLVILICLGIFLTVVGLVGQTSFTSAFSGTSLRTTENPYLITNCTTLNELNQKVYKACITYENRMFPSDPSGSLDDFFPRSYLNFEGAI